MIRVWVLWPGEQDWKLDAVSVRNVTEARAYVRDMRRAEPTVKREVRKRQERYNDDGSYAGVTFVKV